MSRSWIAVATLAVLVGCSSGSESNDAGSGVDAGQSIDAGSTHRNAEGLYFGHIDGGDDVAFLVLDGGAYYEWHYNAVGIFGSAVGTGALTGTTFATTSASITRASAQLTGTLSGSSFDGSLTFAPGAVSPGFAFSAAASSTFDIPASIASIEGEWSTPVILDSQDYGEEAQLVTIDAQGNVTANNPLGCDGAGTLAPDPSGLGYFDFSLTYQGGACIFGTQTLTGVAVVDPSGPQLLTSIVTGDGTDGIVSNGFRVDAGP